MSLNTAETTIALERGLHRQILAEVASFLTTVDGVVAPAAFQFDVRAWNFFSATLVATTNVLSVTTFIANNRDFSDERQIVTSATVLTPGTNQFYIASATSINTPSAATGGMFGYVRFKVQPNAPSAHGTLAISVMGKNT